MKNSSLLGALLAASALVAPQMAMAQSTPAQTAVQSAAAREAATAERIAKLEADLAALRADLAAAKVQGADTARTAQAAAKDAKEAGAKVAAVEKKPVPEGFRSGATTIKLGGYVKLTATSSHFDQGTVTTNSLGRDFYLAQAIPTASATSRNATYADFSAKQTRLWLNLDTSVAGHSLKGYVETDFQTTANAAPTITGGGNQRTTNGYTLALRRAYVQFDKWTIGQDWTTFLNLATLPETTDYLGASEGAVLVRQPLVRYATPLGKRLTLQAALENPESATAALGLATLTENGTDRLPDFVARLNYAVPQGEVTLAVLARQVRTEVAATGADATATGYGASLAGKLFLNDKKSADLRFMATYGQNIGRYLGLNFAPDAVYVATTNTLADVTNFAAFAAVKVAISPTVRFNVMGSMQTVDYDSSLAAASLASYNKKAWSGAVNLFYSPVRPIDLGLEYRHGQRELVSGAKGNLDRLEFSAKYAF